MSGSEGILERSDLVHIVDTVEIIPVPVDDVSLGAYMLKSTDTKKVPLIPAFESVFEISTNQALQVSKYALTLRHTGVVLARPIVKR